MHILSTKLFRAGCLISLLLAMVVVESGHVESIAAYLIIGIPALLLGLGYE